MSSLGDGFFNGGLVGFGGKGIAIFGLVIFLFEMFGTSSRKVFSDTVRCDGIQPLMPVFIWKKNRINPESVLHGNLNSVQLFCIYNKI